MLAPAAQASPPRAFPDAPAATAGLNPSEPTLLARLARCLVPLEIGFGILVTLASVYLHVTQSRVAGGLWRDEVVSVQVANMPTLAQTWRYLEFDSYPALFHLLLRGWCALFTAGDGSLRTLGLLIGLSMVAAFWTAGRTLGVRVPLFALVLLALNPTVIRYGDSMRAYGLGCTLAILSLAAVWAAARAARPDWRRIGWAMVVSVLSVQCLYHNAALLLAACLAGALVALWNRRVSVAAATLAIGVPAAVSLLPYLPIIQRTRRWSVLMKFPITVGWLWRRLTTVTAAPDPLGVWLWTALFIGSVALAGWWGYRAFGRRGPRISGLDQRTFAAMALGASAVLYGGFLFTVGYITQPWYYLALLAFVGICLDAVYGQAVNPTGWRAFRLVVALAFALLVFEQSSALLRVRSTNLDLVAAQLDDGVTSQDLVVVNRWECAISLNRYYHGPARLMTVPPLDDHAVHRYDLVMQALMTPDPLRPLLDAMTETLQHGGRVWLVGPQRSPKPGASGSYRPPPPLDAAGNWNTGPTFMDWEFQANGFLLHHATSGTLVPIRSRQNISEFENLPLSRFNGWREDNTATSESNSPQ